MWGYLDNVITFTSACCHQQSKKRPDDLCAKDEDAKAQRQMNVNEEAII